MATNQFKPFAAGAGANVTTQAQYEALPALSTGFTSGTARSDQVNKALRQGTTIAATIGQFMATRGIDALDNGDVATLESNFRNAVVQTVLALASAKADTVYYQGIPTSGAVTAFERTLTFKAPCSGYVLATQSTNFSSQQPGSIQNYIEIKGSVSGLSSSSDQTLFPMTNSVTKKVSAGETVSIRGAVQSNGAPGSWLNTGNSLSYMFTPGV
ncbi:hypothetical protein [Chitinasiproducens palmae]|uniref:Uncharacterized protein n=1 Tax=Chitinasiproducens palmae TaxID=1770053 RepID=A0A1H2PQJ5_9BURK|nr:hypothetical protein [Chitinasiproducens palmae]SDV49069.1 hypothetical protein SAMN05216551_10739 [Chitinasiproducens palmae]